MNKPVKKILFLELISMLFFSSCKSNKTVETTNINNSKQELNINTTGSETKHNFSICIIPDTQGYVDARANKERKFSFPCNQYEYMKKEIEYIAANSVRNGGNIICALHVGDLVNEGAWSKYEWKKAEQCISILDDQIPYGIVPGNHDYDYFYRINPKPEKLRIAKTYIKYFGPDSKHFKNKSWYGGASDNKLNSYIIADNGEIQFVIIGLEYAPTQESLDWAQKIIDKYPDKPVIIYTHAFIKAGSEQAKFYNNFNRINSIPADEIFANFISNNKNIFLVFSGHTDNNLNKKNSRTDINKAGYPVYSILADYQDQKEILKRDYPDSNANPRWNGDGWIRLINFDLDKKIIHVQTYSPLFEKFETKGDSDFFIPIDWNWDKRFSSN